MNCFLRRHHRPVVFTPLLLISPLLLSMQLAGCADSIGGVTGSTELETGSEPTEGGTTVTVIDATNKTERVGFRFRDGATTTLDDPAGWDLAFQRASIRLNGGASGDGGVAVAWSDTLDWDDTLDGDSALEAPKTGWITDRGAGESIAPAFDADGGWYAYDVATHVLTPRPRIWWVRDTSGGYTVLRFLDYYDASGTSGLPRFEWRATTGPKDWIPPSAALDDQLPALPDDAIRIDGRESWTYLRFDDGVVQPIASPEASLDWDFAVFGSLIKTNGGTSGPGQGAAGLLDDQSGDFPGVDDPAWTNLEWSDDVVLDAPGDGNAATYSGSPVFHASWYDYDEATGDLVPREQVYALRSAEGLRVALGILAYTDGIYDLRIRTMDTLR